MFLETNGIPFLDVLAAYSRTGMLFCLTAQVISIYVGHIFKMPTLQRMAIAITCSYSAFFVGIQLTDSHFIWITLSGMIFYTTYFLTPRFVGEAP